MIQRVAFVRAAVLACGLLAGGDVLAAPLPPPAPAPAQTDTCNLALASRYIGARATPAVRSAIKAVAGPCLLRWIKPGQPIKPDFAAQRLNMILDESARIMAMRCG